MRRAKESLRLLGRLASLAERTPPAAHVGAAWQPPSAAGALARQLGQQAAPFYSVQCGRQLLGGGRAAAAAGLGRRPCRPVSLRHFSSEAPQGSDSRIIDLINQRLGTKANDQMLYGVGGWAGPPGGSAWRQPRHRA